MSRSGPASSISLLSSTLILVPWSAYGLSGTAHVERLADAGVEPSVGSVGNSYDTALAETINRLYKAGVIDRRGASHSFEAVEFANWNGSTGHSGC